VSRISKVFNDLPEGEGALVAYVMGGDPDVQTSAKVLEAVVRGGADIVEVGIPFSDPIADGKSIQAAGVRALSAGTTPKDVLGMVSAFRARSDVPVAVMTYYNVLYSNGLGRFFDSAEENGVDGVIIPDLPLDEAADCAAMAKARGIDTILLAAPTTSPDRMKAIVKHASGFLYLVSLLGVTGARSSLQQGTPALIKFARKYTKGKVPLGVGFGISEPAHVREVLNSGADAVIVGSGIVDRVSKQSEKGAPKMFEEVEGYVRSMKSATRG